MVKKKWQLKNLLLVLSVYHQYDWVWKENCHEMSIFPCTDCLCLKFLNNITFLNEIVVFSYSIDIIYILLIYIYNWWFIFVLVLLWNSGIPHHVSNSCLGCFQLSQLTTLFFISLILLYSYFLEYLRIRMHCGYFCPSHFVFLPALVKSHVAIMWFSN